MQRCLKLENQCIPLLCKLTDFQYTPSLLHQLRATASRCVCRDSCSHPSSYSFSSSQGFCYLQRWIHSLFQLPHLQLFLCKVQDADCSLWWECWAAEVMLSSSFPCPPEQHQGRCGRAEQEHSKPDSSSSATFRLCHSRCSGGCSFFLCVRKKEEHKQNLFFVSQQLTKQEHLWSWMPQSLPECWGGEVFRTLLAQSGHFLSIRKSGSGLCYPSVRKATKQLSINYFSGGMQIAFTWDRAAAGQSLCSTEQSCSSTATAPLAACDSWGYNLC